MSSVNILSEASLRISKLVVPRGEVIEDISLSERLSNVYRLLAVAYDQLDAACGFEDLSKVLSSQMKDCPLL